eukprot:m.206368 g.206368  ORF g.206368 m.206368 type:complete len:449 (-) comp18899_c0_seq1:103-1449(-)
MCDIHTPNFLDTVDMVKTPNLNLPSSPGTWWPQMQGSEIMFSPSKSLCVDADDLPVLRLSSNDLKIEFQDLATLEPVSPLSSIPLVDAAMMSTPISTPPLDAIDDSVEDIAVVPDDFTPSPGSGGECDYDMHILDSGVDADSDDSSSCSSAEFRENRSAPGPGSTREKSRGGGKIGPRSGEALVAGITPRERILLQRQHVTVPSVLPLTKPEERALRQALRKIRNKASAQRSRRNKEGYIKGLEQRVEHCTKVNVDLETKVTKLQETNTSLLDQLHELRKMVFGSADGRNNLRTSTSTMLTMAAVLMGIQWGPCMTGGTEPTTGTGSSVVFRSRTLQGVVPGTVPSSTSYLGAVIPVALALVMLAIAVVAVMYISRRRRQADNNTSGGSMLPPSDSGLRSAPAHKYLQIHDDWLQQPHTSITKGLPLSQRANVQSLLSTLKSTTVSPT